MKIKQKCIAKFEKIENTKVLYLYKHNDSGNSYDNFKFIKDRGVLKNKFFEIMYNNNLLIIKPDGDYFLSGGHFTNRQLKTLLKNTDRTPFIDDWNESVNKKPINGSGFFKNNERMYSHKKHCF